MALGLKIFLSHLLTEIVKKCSYLHVKNGSHIH